MIKRHDIRDSRGREYQNIAVVTHQESIVNGKFSIKEGSRKC